MDTSEGTFDTPTLCQHLYRLGLVNEEMIAEVKEEAGSPNPDVKEFLRIMQRKQYLTQWQVGKVLRGDVDGFFLGGYRLLYRIASGTFGRVYRADEPSTGRIVAMKVLRRRWTEKKEVIDLFFREGRMGMTLKHPNIVEILQVAQDSLSQQYYIVMEFVEGGNLREILQIHGKFEVARALHIVEETAAGLVYAYANGVTHRDMKLTNILMSSEKTAKLVDFGLAQVYTTMGGQEKDKVDRTVDYAGLEKATNVKTGDIRSDIYFLGCVLYNLLTDRSPLEMTRSARARMEKQRFDSVQPIKPDEITAPPSVFNLVETMMSLNADRRYQTPSQMLDAIKTARREVEGKSAVAGISGSNRTLFVVEADEGLQDVFREKFKELGYRVLIAGDPGRASDRFRQQPFDALIINLETVGEEGVLIFEHIMFEAQRKNLPCVGIALVGKEQDNLQTRIRPRPCTAVLVHPVKIKQLRNMLTQLMAAEEARLTRRQ